MDDLLAPVFIDMAEVEWSEHIPLLIDYWCRILLGHPGYQDAILSAHQHVHDREALTAEHFDRWYSLWAATIDDRWAGPCAERAKHQAAKIGATLARRISSIDWAAPRRRRQTDERHRVGSRSPSGPVRPARRLEHHESSGEHFIHVM